MTDRSYITLDVYKDDEDFLIIETTHTEPSYELRYIVSPSMLESKGLDYVLSVIRLMYFNGLYYAHLYSGLI